MMKIRLAKTAGFCMGVRRAVEIALDLQRTNPPLPVVTYGPLIHNPQTLELLKSRGIDQVESLDRIENWIQTYEVGETRIGLIILTMDSVYSDDTNVSIMVAALVPLVTKRIRGAITVDDFNERLAKLRDVLK